MSNSLLNQIQNYIKINNIASLNDKILVGLSGGADSVALLCILKELGYECRAAHCNFHLRGDESQRDENFCRQLCSDLNIQLLVKDFNVTQQQKLTGESIEMACRTLRYEWWNSLINEGYADLIAVGHHLEDNVETFLINALRGSGLNGLKGMLPKSRNVIRPLLGVRRSDIENYLSYREIGYVTDSTNNQSEFKRNKLRNIIIPAIEQYFPQAISSMGKTVDFLRDNYGLYTDYISRLRNTYVIPQKGIDVAKIVINEPHAKMVLFELIHPIGFNMTHVINILSAYDGDGKCDSSGKYFTNSESNTLLLDRGILKIIDLDEEEGCDVEFQNIDFHESNPCDGLFKTSIISKDEFNNLKNSHGFSPNSLYIDSVILDTNHNFTLRGWRSGDKIRPFGLNGSKLLSDIFSDLKLSVDLKRKVKVLTCDDEIIWVVGLRASNLFRVTNKTDKVLVITYEIVL